MVDAYSHIKERPVIPVGEPVVTGSTYINSTNTYDVAIAGQPFFLFANQNYPYKRETAQYRKQQIDQTREPGEQTLTGWWLRSQSSFHYGAGIRYEEPVQGETVPYRYTKSAGVEVFNIGKVTLLPGVTASYTNAGSTHSMVGGTDTAGVDVLFVADGSTLKRVTSSGSTTITWGGTGNILALAQDGVNYYAANATGIYKGTLAGGSGSLIFTHPASVGSVTSVKMAWVKQRLIAGINNYLFEVTPVTSYTVIAANISQNVTTLQTSTAHNFSVGTQITVGSITADYNGTWSVTAIPSATQVQYYHNKADMNWTTGLTGTVVLATNSDNPIYAHPNSAWVWTGICEGPNAIYASGYAGSSSTIYRLALDTNGAVPLLSRAVTAADMPYGEQIYSLGSYLGKFLAIGTSNGLRIGQIDTSGYLSSGYITYGPLTFVTKGYDPVSGTTLTGSPVVSVAFQDRFVYAAVTNYIDNGDGTYSSGLMKVDLSREISANQYAYATHLRTMTTDTVNDVAIWGVSNKLAVLTTAKLYTQSANAVASGYIQTGLIRYLTLEDKHFELVKVRTYGAVTGNILVSNIDNYGNITNVITVTSDFDITQDIGVRDVAPTEAMALRFTLYPSATDPTSGSIFSGYQLKALPAVQRQRMIQIPLANYDFEQDRYNMMTGYEGRATTRLFDLETIEANGDVIILQDFTSGEEVQGVIESLQFMRSSPPDRRFSGFGGIIYATVRTI